MEVTVDVFESFLFPLHFFTSLETDLVVLKLIYSKSNSLCCNYVMPAILLRETIVHRVG